MSVLITDEKKPAHPKGGRGEWWDRDDNGFGITRIEIDPEMLDGAKKEAEKNEKGLIMPWHVNPFSDTSPIIVNVPFCFYPTQYPQDTKVGDNFLFIWSKKTNHLGWPTQKMVVRLTGGKEIIMMDELGENSSEIFAQLKQKLSL